MAVAEAAIYRRDAVARRRDRDYSVPSALRAPERMDKQGTAAYRKRHTAPKTTSISAFRDP